MNYEWLKPDSISTRDIADMNELLLQLTDSPVPLNLVKAAEVAEKSFWLVCRDDQGRIKGMNTLTISHIPTGRVGHLDDVVVDGSLRGQGVAANLVTRLIEVAGLRGVDRVELTCKPSRVEANRLYQKLGFKRRETNCYALKLTEESLPA